MKITCKSDLQIMQIFNQVRSGVLVSELRKGYGMSRASFYK
jgi:hypothetical protein